MGTCKICGREAKESRFGAPCYDCIPQAKMTGARGADAPVLTIGVLNGLMKSIPRVPPPMEFFVQTAEQQQRTPRDVKVRRISGRPPSKREGRKGTRKAWKRKHPPRWLCTYREPTDILVMKAEFLVLNTHNPGADVAIVTPAQMAAIEAVTVQRENDACRRDLLLATHPFYRGPLGEAWSPKR